MDFVPCMLRKHTDYAHHRVEHPCCNMYLKRVQTYTAYKNLILIHCCFFKKVTTSSAIANQTVVQRLGEQEGRREDIKEESHINTLNEEHEQCKKNQ